MSIRNMDFGVFPLSLILRSTKPAQGNVGLLPVYIIPPTHGTCETEEAKCSEQLSHVEQAREALRNEEALHQEINSRLGEMLSWAELYSGADMETKKMIVSSLIKRVEVFRDYKLNVAFNFDINQYLNGLDFSA